MHLRELGSQTVTILQLINQQGRANFDLLFLTKLADIAVSPSPYPNLRELVLDQFGIPEGNIKQLRCAELRRLDIAIAEGELTGGTGGEEYLQELMVRLKLPELEKFEKLTVSFG